jgi:uncharacterized delta-60 repeat protein
MHRPPNSPLRRMTRCASVVALSLVLGIGTASALPGDLDPTFGNGGIVTTPFGSFQDAKAVVIQPDGKIVAARGQDGNASSDFCLARYNADGSLDSSFDGDGHTDFDGNTDSAEALLLQPDGKLVAVGIAVDPGGPLRRIAISLPPGRLRSTRPSAAGGKVRITSGASAYDAVLDPAGTVTAVGWTSHVGPRSNFVIVRVGADGALDPTFGSGGSSTSTSASRASLATTLSCTHRSRRDPRSSTLSRFLSLPSPPPQAAMRAASFSAGVCPRSAMEKRSTL